MLRQGDDIGDVGAEIRLQIPHANRIRAEPGHQAGARGVAQGLLGVCLKEGHARASQPVEVRCLGVGVAVRADRGAEIVDGDEEHVGALAGEAPIAGVYPADGQKGDHDDRTGHTAGKICQVAEHSDKLFADQRDLP